MTATQNEVTKKIRKEVMSATQLQVERVCGNAGKKLIEELALIAFADIKKFVEVDEYGIVRALPFDSLSPKKTSRVIKKVKEKRVIRTVKGTESKPDGEEVLDSTFEFELHSKIDAIRELILLGGYRAAERHEVSGKDGGPILTKAVELTDDELLSIARGGGSGTTQAPKGQN